MRTFAPALVLLLACGTDHKGPNGNNPDGGGSGNPDASTLGAPAFDVKSGDIQLAPGQQVTYCWYFKTPNKIFDWQLPAVFQPTHRLVYLCFNRHANNRPGRIVIGVSQAEIAKETGLGVATVQRAMAFLQKIGLVTVKHQGGTRHGDVRHRSHRVAVLAQNNPEWCLTFWGTVSIGGVLVGLNGWWTTDEVMYGLEDSGAKVLVAHAGSVR